MKFLTNPLSGLALLLTIMTLSGCGTHKDLVYMQNDTYGQLEEILNLNKIKVQPQDQLSIIVSCKEEELASLVNLKRPTASGGGGESGRLVYTVDESGDINFPQLGKIHIAGLTREEISEKIGGLLIQEELLSDPIVIVEFSNLHFSALGAVNSPGSYSITNDKLTLLEGLAMAGDLSPNGEREIVVIREQGGQRIKYIVDLRDKNIFDSPVYYLQQNDIVYVKPDNKIARQAADNPNDFKSIGLWISIVTFVSTMAVLVFK